MQRIVLESGPADGYTRRISIPPQTYLVPCEAGSWAYEAVMDLDEGTAVHLRDEENRLRYTYAGPTDATFTPPNPLDVLAEKIAALVAEKLNK